MSNIVHKIKDAVTHDHHDKPSTSTNAGPHDSNVANKADPRVDSDRDHRAAHTAAGTGAAGSGDGFESGSGAYNTRSTAGGANLNTASHGVGTGSGVGATTTTTGAGTGTSTTGPHSSSLENKLDPRVNSDRAQHGTLGDTTTTSGAYTTNPTATNAGPHSSNLANKADPRVDSDLDNRARHQALSANDSSLAGGSSSYTTPGSGTAQQTAGPHDSNLTNKLDPRVDSDLDNSRTVGGDRTHY